MKIDVDEVVKAVRKLAEERPEYRYESIIGCYYTKGGDDGLGCLVGQALVLLYPEVKDTLVRVDNRSVSEVPCLPELLTTLGVTDDPSSEDKLKIRWLRDVQMFQDRGHRWSKAVELADAEVRSRK